MYKFFRSNSVQLFVSVLDNVFWRPASFVARLGLSIVWLPKSIGRPALDGMKWLRDLKGVYKESLDLKDFFVKSKEKFFQDFHKSFVVRSANALAAVPQEILDGMKIMFKGISDKDVRNRGRSHEANTNINSAQRSGSQGRRKLVRRLDDLWHKVKSSVSRFDRLMGTVRHIINLPEIERREKLIPEIRDKLQTELEESWRKHVEQQRKNELAEANRGIETVDRDLAKPIKAFFAAVMAVSRGCLLYTSPSPRDA